MDLFPTLARIVGGKVPSDRVIDGVDQLDFFRGEEKGSNREAVIVYVGTANALNGNTAKDIIYGGTKLEKKFETVKFE